MIANVLLVAIGSALGGVLRYLVGLSFPFNPVIHDVAVGTLTVNVVGSFLAGMFLAWSLAGGLLQGQVGWQLFLIVGFCGGFTTFSTFSLDTLVLLQQGEPYAALVNSSVSVFGSLAAAGAGYSVGWATG
jgi:CrcB protein